MQGLKPTDKLFKLKVKILAELILQKDMGHILDDRLVEWAKKSGIKVELHCEDRTSWWTCKM